MQTAQVVPGTGSTGADSTSNIIQGVPPLVNSDQESFAGKETAARRVTAPVISNCPVIDLFAR